MPPTQWLLRILESIELLSMGQYRSFDLGDVARYSHSIVAGGLPEIS